MRQTAKLFRIGLGQIARDGILLALLPAPVMVGLLFKLAVPLADKILEERFSFSLLRWYGLVDGFLICLTPMLTAMISAFLMLEERDEGISAFYRITPAGGRAYLAARVGLPMVWAAFNTIIITLIFGLSGLPIASVLCCSLISTLTGLALALMVTAMAANRVEGLALSKLMGVSLLGLPAVWAVPAPYDYLAAFLPSFWIGRIIADGTIAFPLLSALPLCGLWIFIFAKKLFAGIT